MEVRLPRYGRKHLFVGFAIRLTTFASLFLELFKVILRRLKLLMPRYWRKHLFAGIAIMFMTFTVLFLEHWRLFCVDLRYGCLDTGENNY